MTIRLLRGRVIVKPIAHDYGQRLLHIPDTYNDDPREDTEKVKRGGRSLGRGVVLAMGPPAFAPKCCKGCGGRPAQLGDNTKCRWCKGSGRVSSNIETVPGFSVGDEVYFLGQHVSRDVLWGDEKCKAVAQEEIAIVCDREVDA